MNRVACWADGRRSRLLDAGLASSRVDVPMARSAASVSLPASCSTSTRGTSCGAVASCAASGRTGLNASRFHGRPPAAAPPAGLPPVARSPGVRPPAARTSTRAASDGQRPAALRLQLGCRLSRVLLAFGLQPRGLDASRFLTGGLLPLRFKLGCRLSRRSPGVRPLAARPQREPLPDERPAAAAPPAGLPLCRAVSWRSASSRAASTRAAS
jgi:hypothetical protein